ncbi:MAG TPA: OmpA family protein [Acetobacteraceae bacterium]|jgi:OOP family OmpA-OmpF porin|nr:OmpA family protein [Acetobacteraceae bacterium]
MQLRSALLAATVMALPLAAQAQPVTGLYVGAGVGINYLEQETIGTPHNVFGGGQFKSKIGPAAELSVGWGFGNGLRAEVEGNWMDNKFDNIGGFQALSSAGGWEQKYGALVNVLYDFNGLVPWVVPYIGVGVGYEEASFQSVQAFGNGGTINVNNNSKGGFAYQAKLGAAFPVPTAPGLALTAEYRFLGLAGTRDYGGTATPAGGGPSIGFRAQASSDYNHAFLIGLRYNFLPPPPPPPAPVAAPAPAPARSYLVFFDWDKATLTPRAQQIIGEAAANSTKVKYTQIQVNGYTDTSGTPQYNQGLSIRRANAVAAELVRDGVPKGAISIQGFGETHLLVPTGPGVREPQNRRVEIIIR